MKTKLISLVSVILLSIGAIYADKVKIGDLYYNLNDADLTAEVAQSPLEPNYEGLTDIEIPSSVTYNDVQYSVTSIGDGAFDDCSYLTSVTIPNSVTTIGAMAFDWCASLTAVTIPNSVINIKSGAFYYCQGLSSLEIPSSVTNIENSAFFGCTRVTSITVDAGNPIYDSRDNCNAIVETASNTLILGCQNTIIPSSVISIGDGAYAGSGLDSIDIPNNITSIGDGAFSACFNLIWATIPISVTHMGEGVFQNCNGLSSVTISANVTDIGNNVFAGCYDLSSVNILSSITSIGDEAFRDCTQLKSITIPTSVTSIGSSAFGWCTVLNSIDIPNNVTSIGYGAFQMCSRLNSITCRATNAPNLEGDNAFSDVDKSIPIYVPSSSVSAYQAASGWSEFTNIQAIPSSEPDYKYYIVGSMNDWSVNENYEMTLNSESWATEYMIEIALTTASQFKVVKVDGENQTWYPDGMGNNYGENGEIAKDGTYTIYFRPNNDGGNDWFYNCIYADRHLVQEPVVLAALFPENGKPTAGIKVLGSFSADALDMELIEATGYYAHYSITATEEDVFYFRDAADEENVLYKKNYSGEWDTATFTFGDLWADDAWKGEPVKWVELDLNDNNQYAWKNAIQSSDGSKVKIGDLYYNLNEADLTAEVASQHNGSAYWLTEITTADIPASVTYNGVTYSVTSIRDSAFYSCNYLTSVTIPGSVTSIGASAFSGCGLLTSIDIPSSVTTIGHQAFLGCSKLTSITIPNSVTSIGFETFRSCSSLTSIIIPSSVTSIGEQAFMSCDGLTSVTIQNGVTSIGDFAFTTCWKLTAIDIPSSVTTIGRQAFNNCFTLTSVTIPSSVTSIGDGAFSACFGLTSMSVESGNSVYDSRDNCNAIIETATNTLVAGCQNTVIPSSVTSIGLNAFSYCSSLTSIVIPSSVISIGDGAFSSCSSLTSIDIPSSVTSIGQYAFSYCRGLTSIEIPGSVVSIGSDAFSDCSGLTSITCRSTNTPSMGNSVFSDVSKSIPLYVPSSSVAAYQAAEGWSEFANIQAISGTEGTSDIIASGTCGAQGDNLTWELSSDSILTISGTGDMGQYSQNDAPWNEHKLSIKKVIINNGVTSVGKFAFYKCNNLSYASLPESLTSIQKCGFAYCDLREITIPDNVTELGVQAFLDNANLTSLIIPRDVTSIGNSLVQACTNLSAIIVDTNNPVYDSRQNCNAIIQTDDNALVVGCKNSTIAQSITSISSTAFIGCYGLTSIVIPNYITNLGTNAFANCSGLKSIVLPDNITTIDEGLFFGCYRLESITIPQYVTSIGSSAFLNCNQLSTITCEATTPPTLGENVFKDVVKSIPLYVPSGSVDAYKAASGWSEFTNIRAIGGNSGGNTPIFPGDPGTLTLNLELKAAVVDGDEIQGYEPTGGGGYAKGSSVTITAQEIRGYEFVQWSDSVTDKSRTIELNESMTLTALYSHSMIEIPVAANKWTFICLPPLGDRQYSADMFTYDGLTDVQWGTYNGAKRAAGQSGWETPETFNALQGYIIFSTTAGTLRINAYEDDIRQGESGNTIHAGMIDYASSHTQNANWNFVGNPFSQGYSIAGFAAAGITSPITVWNGVGYTTYTPGIDSYILNPFEAFFIQKAENGAEGITFNPEYLEGDDGGNSGSADDGALSGAFSVAAGTQIHFSKGNLQYQASTDTWRFAENQYDMIGNDNANISDSYSGWIDMFGWGTGNNPTNSSTDYNDYSTFVDWGINAISNGGNKANLWRTLTNDEWGYLFYDRPNASGKYGKATVAGINGIIVLPDDFNGLGINTSRSAWDNNTFSAEDWAAYEADGAVFLPAAGYREGADVSGVGSVGNYWSSTPSSEPSAYNLLLDSNGINPQDAYYRYRGRSVRLVR